MQARAGGAAEDRPMIALPCPPAHIALGAALLLSPLTPAQAQGRLDASYAISLMGITVGKASWRASITTYDYVAAASGEASGIVKVVASGGEGAASAHGKVRDRRLFPSSYTSSVTRDDKIEIRMALDAGAVTELKAETPPPSAERVPVGDVHKAGIVDPLSALLVATEEGLTSDACRRSLPVFDGRHRYDLQLTFKRMDKVKAERGYQGPVVVCAVRFQPIAGHRSNSTLTNFLAGGRDIELWLAPIAGTSVLAPFRASVASMVGNLVIQAKEFETAPLPSRRAAAE
jgi:hypothetical protein